MAVTADECSKWIPINEDEEVCLDDVKKMLKDPNIDPMTKYALLSAIAAYSDDEQIDKTTVEEVKEENPDTTQILQEKQETVNSIVEDKTTNSAQPTQKIKDTIPADKSYPVNNQVKKDKKVKPAKPILKKETTFQQNNIKAIQKPANTTNTNPTYLEIGKLPDKVKYPASAFGVELPKFEDIAYVINLYDPHIIVFDDNSFTRFKLKSIEPALGIKRYTIYANAAQISFTENTSYGQTFLERLNNLFAPTVSQLTQLYGTRSGTEAVEIAKQQLQAGWEALKQSIPGLSAVANMLSGGFNLAQSILSPLANKAAETQVGQQVTEQGQKVLNLLKVLATGGKIILPKVWQSSSMQFQIQVKVTLICDDENQWENQVGNPLKHLIGISMPVLDKTQQEALILVYPALWKLDLKGLRKLKNAFVADLSTSVVPDYGFTKDGKPMALEVNLTFQDVGEIAPDTQTPVFTTLDEVIGLK